jgi:threonine/homoserine/homoserine lactone efflux protein
LPGGIGKGGNLLPYLVFGAGMAFAAAVQPGPLQAFLLAKVAEKGVKATLPAALAPLLSDGPIILLTLLILKNLPPNFARVLRGAGGLLLVYLAYSAFRQWLTWRDSRSEGVGAAPRTLAQAVAVNLLNPNPYLGWSLVLGPKLLEAWREGPANAIALLGGFYGTMVFMLALSIVFFGSARFFGEGVRRALVLASAITLAVLGLIQCASSLS